MPRILLVEDEADARELLARGLTRLGFEVVTASGGDQAFRDLDDHIDVVVTDLLMPQGDGLTLLERVPLKNPTALRIVMTSFGDKERVLAALNRGADYLLEKPFSAAQLAGVLERLLHERADTTGDLDHLLQRRLSSLELTERERRFVVYVLKGLTNAELAEQLGLKEQSVKNALFGLYRKLGITSRGELFHVVFPI